MGHLSDQIGIYGPHTLLNCPASGTVGAVGEGITSRYAAALQRQQIQIKDTYFCNVTTLKVNLWHKGAVVSFVVTI